MGGFFAGAALEYVLAIIVAAVIFGVIFVPRLFKKETPAEDELGEDVPPEFPGTMRPKSLPDGFGKSPGRK